MRRIVLSLAVLGLLSGSALAESAMVASGVKSLITRHWHFDGQCRSSRIIIKVVEPPANGKVTSQAHRVTVPATSPRGGAQNSQCIGKSVQGVAVYYQSRAGFVGQDSFRYVRLNPNDAGDRSSGEIGYTITVR